MKQKVITTVLFFYLISLPAISQYNISISIPDFPNSSLLFGHYFNESIMIQDTFFTNNIGKAVIQGENTLPSGMYTIYLPNKARFDLIIDEDREFKIATDTLDLLNHTKISGSDENLKFYEYLTFLGKKRMESQAIQKRIQNPVSKNDSIKAREEMLQMNESVNAFIENVIEEGEGSFLSVFLLSMKEVEVPDPPKDENGEITDKNFQAVYYKQHYFENFKLSDVRLLRTPVYEKKITDYLDRWVYPEPDSIFNEVDMLLAASRSDTLLFKYMLTTLFNYYAKSKYIGMDAVYAYIAEKYYIPEASWSDPDFIEKLKERVEKINPLVIGKKGPDIQLRRVTDDHFRAAESNPDLKKDPHAGYFFNLHEIQAKYTILYFWESDCGHCKKTIPVLHEMYYKLKEKGVEIIAVNMLGGIEGKEKWADFINENGLYDWINAWNPYDYTYKEVYDVGSSNILYLLDKDKVIMAKKIAPEQVEEIINLDIKKEQ
ncbi:MAG: DUF5106 domain-containing protein [Bacteroidales bacterium]|nr:DUF5106 domain-containing protein [Bacteroidales bacterium]MCF8391469.1 DUF5106 domain-containing protein [Bacteroidales bacterium]